jgi:hypothetical protein
MGAGKIIGLLKRNGWKVFHRPFELNIIGLRKNTIQSNRFDDELHVIYKDDKGQVHNFIYKITTDPGTYWLTHPSLPKGTAILKQGQYLNAYGLGFHKGKYKALVQQKPVTIFRDYDRDATLDFNNGNEERGIFGINIHRAAAAGSTKVIDKYSAGCQVFENADEFKEFIGLCEQHRALYGNTFTYSLVDFRSLIRTRRKHIAYVGMTLAAVVLYFISGEKVFDFPSILNRDIFSKKKQDNKERRTSK